MKLIKKIEINYYRSLYKATLNDVGDLNVVFGRNDSGKSNLLRALNLFFNDKTDAGHDFDFTLDMSDPRKKEAREAKGRQFLWIQVTFNVPKNYQTKLGQTIAIKKQWNRDGEVTETTKPALNTQGEKSRLTHFLNGIDFTYIPAVKDLEVYADLIERLYGAAAQGDAMQIATDNFIAAIDGEATDLNNRLIAMLDAPAHIRAPTDMKRLFRNLDFAQGDDSHSLLRQKGDGIKARYLPELLHFINENEARSKFYLWGFEEPENSLDLGAATTEAQRFAKFSAHDDVQIFITSHSPAFYLAEAENATVHRFFVSKQKKDAGKGMTPSNAVAQINDLDDAEHSMEHAGLLQLPFVIRRMEEQKSELEGHKEEAIKLRTTLAALELPTLFVEGQHDVTLFSAALERTGHAGGIEVKPLRGTPNTVNGLIKALLAQGGLSPTAPAFFLYDNDNAGREAASALLKKGSVGKEPAAVAETIFSWTLPMCDTFRQFLKTYKITQNKAFFTAEFLFPSEDAAILLSEIVEQHQNEPTVKNWKSEIHYNYFKDLNQGTFLGLQNAAPGTPAWFYARGVPNCLKEKFMGRAIEADWNTGDIDNIVSLVAGKLLPHPP